MPRGDGTGPPSGRGSRAGRMSGTRTGAGPGGTVFVPAVVRRHHTNWRRPVTP